MFLFSHLLLPFMKTLLTRRPCSPGKRGVCLFRLPKGTCCDSHLRQSFLTRNDSDRFVGGGLPAAILGLIWNCCLRMAGLLALPTKVRPSPSLLSGSLPRPLSEAALREEMTGLPIHPWKILLRLLSVLVF